MKSALGPAVAQAFRAACRLDVAAFKPGNVSLLSPGHGMRAEDFLRSSECAAGPMAEAGLSVGERVLRSIESTRAAVGCNTNLGIVLLCAPLAQAVLWPGLEGGLQTRLGRVLAGLDREDARRVFRAICIAGPAGLGAIGAGDVRTEPQLDLRAAMARAEAWDRIARQYAHDYADVFSLGLSRLRAALMERGDGIEAATVACYLAFLATYPDTHVARKYGNDRAEGLRRVAKEVETRFKACENFSAAMRLLRDFDNKLKRERLNPGTSADLTVASLFAWALEHLLADGDLRCLVEARQ